MAAQRTISLNNRLLVLPIDNDGPKSRLEIQVDGIVVHRLDICLAADEAQTDWNAYLEMDEYLGKEAQLTIPDQAEQSLRQGFDRIVCASAVANAQPLYAETLRPQLRFSQKQGWNNDPNGLVYLNGRYHLYWQSNPVGLPWGNMYWGHAVSSDLVHWTEQPLALHPWGAETPTDKRASSMARGQCFSGSANIWPKSFNSPTFLEQVIKPLFGCSTISEEARSNALFAMFTDTQAGESLAVSLDQGQTWKYAPTNPAIPHRGRDPKLIWFPPEETLPGYWIVAAYNEKENPTAENPNNIIQQITFYRSDDLISWTRTGEIDGFYECPELYQLPVDNDQKQKKWVLWAADGKYVVGQFDGKTFVPDPEFRAENAPGQVLKKSVFGPRFYAAQCFSQLPNERVVTIGWAQIPTKPVAVSALAGQPRTVSMPFNQTFSVPLELSLRSTKTGTRLFAEPVEELNALRIDKQSRTGALNGNQEQNLSLKSFGDGQLYDIQLTLKTSALKSALKSSGKDKIAIIVGKTQLEYDFSTGFMAGAAAGQSEPIFPDANGNLTIRLLVDRPMIDLSVQNGAFYQPILRTDGGEPIEKITIKRIPNANEPNTDAIEYLLDAYSLQSAWK